MAPKENTSAIEPVKIDKWDGSSVKNALDDAIKEVFTTKLNYAENFMLIDLRLSMCAIAVAVALFALLWDHLNPFPQSKTDIYIQDINPFVFIFLMIYILTESDSELHAKRPVLIFCVSTYFVMMGILTLYTTYKEKGIFVVAVQKNESGVDNVWEASSYLKKYDDKYNFHLVFRDGKTGKSRETSFTKSVANFIDVNGVICHDIVEPEIIKLHNSLLSDRKEK